MTVKCCGYYLDKFSAPPETDSGNRCILVYSGIHYDAATIAPILEAPDDFHQTLIPREKDGEGVEGSALVAAKKLADKLRTKRAYTNTSTFDLRCQVSASMLFFSISVNHSRRYVRRV